MDRIPKEKERDPKAVEKTAKASRKARMAMEHPTTTRRAKARKEMAKARDLGPMTAKAKGSSLHPRASSFTTTSDATDVMAKVI